eukprot:Nitzschia sp. Nitz4//scaffold3_size479765//275655//276650//NITZ4_000114-RA/size479765-processed-gene-1.462-mRNA-1//1//CDS//3329550800//4851//frame0
MPSTPRPPLWKVWLVASRPHTLTASITPLIVSYNAGITEIEGVNGMLYLRLSLQCALFAILIQLGTNLHNDYADFVNGADTEKRVGQARATQKGWLTPLQTLSAAGAVLGMAFLVGLTLVFYAAEGFQRIIMFIIVTSSVFNAFAYTGGPVPLGWIGLGDFSIGYWGLGDIFVFLYFGLIATLTLPCLYVAHEQYVGNTTVGQVFWRFLPYAVQVSALATNILVVNNLRDRHTDVEAGKRTLAVRWGARFCRMEYISMVVATYFLVVLDVIVHGYKVMRLLPLLTIPLAQAQVNAVLYKDGSALNAHIGGSAKLQLLFCVLSAIGMRLSSY